MTTRCKCHGVSGSCEVRTCWRAMPTLRQVGDHLKEKFDSATEVTHIQEEDRVALTQINVERPRFTNQDLVYTAPSPDFCEADLATGFPGTKGRMCQKDSAGMDSCGSLCCGRGFVTKQRTVIESCECKFHWCCEVRCKQCVRTIEEHFCR